LRFTRRRLGAIGVSVAMIGGAFALSVATAPIASADTTQTNACLGVTGTFSDFAVPITGTGTPNPDTLPASIALNNTSVAISVASSLIGAGVTTGLVQAADSLADLGVTDNTGAANPLAGIDAVTAAAGKVTLKIKGTNTVEGTQTASNGAIASTTFYVTADSSGGSVVVYSSVNPVPAGNGTDVPVPGRTGTVLTGNLVVNIPLSSTTWTPTGGNVVFSEAQVTPSTNVAASMTPADKAAAPLIIGARINANPPAFTSGGIQVPFNCWVGNSSADTLSYTAVTTSQAIDTVTVIAPPAPPVCTSPQAMTVGGNQSNSVTPACTDVNGDFTLSGSSIALVGANGGATAGTVVVNANGSITYTNTNPLAPTDTITYNATDAGGHTSTNVTVNVTILGNQCTAAPSCSLNQVIILPVLPSTLSMSEGHLSPGNPAGGDYGNPSFSQAVLGGTLAGQTCNVTGGIILNGQPQTACGIMNSVTVINARGTDAQWDVTGQVSDFVDGTRGPLDVCSSPGSATPGSAIGVSPNNIAQTPKDNHCIPGDNLGWIPTAQILDPSVPGDTAAINAGGIILPPGSTAQTPPAFPPSATSARTNTNSVLTPYSILNLTTPGPGLHDAAQELCGAPVNQSGGTFQCDAGLLLAVPGSAAAGTYTALLTLTLA
jgi:hypothetical protein